MTRLNQAWGAFLLLGLSACHTARNQAPSAPGFPAFSLEGHRGARGLMPENTIPAMKKAIDLGVTTLEMDVVISKDEKVVVSHDTYFHQDFCLTPEGKTLTKEEAFKRVLYTMPYDSIVKYDVGSKPHPGFPRQEKMKVHRPLLEDLITEAEAYAKQKGHAPLWYNIETKTQAGKDGLHHPLPEPFTDLLVEVIRKKGIASRTVIQSFDMRTIQVVNRKYPGIKTSFLVDAKEKRTLDEQLKALGFTPFIYSPNYNMVTEQLVKDCHARGMKIIPWTPNAADEIRKLKALGVDGVITDYPDLFGKM